MAIFKRGDRIASDTPPPVSTPLTNHTAASDDVAAAEEKVKSLLGQHEEPALSGTSSATAAVFQPTASTSPPPKPVDPKPTTSEHSVLDNEASHKPVIGKKDTSEAADNPPSTIAVKDSGDTVIEDVDREVQELVDKLEGESANLDAEITSKTEQIQKLQGEIDAHNARKSEIDKKVAGLRQVVGGSNSPLSTL